MRFSSIKSKPSVVKIAFVLSNWGFLIGPDGVIAKVFLKVSPGGHSAEILAALSQLREKR